ncbi:DUF413 domain-containing protein [Enterovibrio norvegicus]|uniref:Macrodomain Ori protein n=2 Tax=Enterovibrio norvegicus TaxID=188144 RepID=A0A2N7LG16_9GAMM|nr:DUF413 domain-containing protein [Enterovibrio norvegicus]MCC4800892.1 DUF413 domain-containing protein [Enterovibrio norvegicus]OEE60909.1 hypothetical protein A1OS_19865 [Enterovibrio norvegicus]OEF56023.1 hypothetical protein A1OU_14690 [Enterovibrio norvegicus]OEF61235.1 hypothetical protein A1OW_20220 [Enterovibrio norvegicus]PMH69964.1 hypothetical protein BCU62_25250 [Enterovibrio norvegicus]
MFSGQRFFDDKHFPKGFARSGYFTIKDAQLLETCGRTMKALFEGTMVPQDEEQQKFVDEVNGRRAAESQYSICWLKYLKEINHKHVVYNLCSTSRGGAAEDYSEAEADE